jgi:hypothetical protein
MQAGYLVLETCAERPDLVFVGARDRAPVTPPPAGLRFVAWFKDLDAALMHFHTGCRRALEALEPRCYRVDLIEAMAIADAIELEHRRVFIDPEVAGQEALDVRIAALHQRQRAYDRWLNAVGLAAVVILLLQGLLPL